MCVLTRSQHSGFGAGHCSKVLAGWSRAGMRGKVEFQPDRRAELELHSVRPFLKDIQAGSFDIEHQEKP